jgi:predicted nucleic acid-binding protein
LEPADVARGQELEVSGFQTYDALHIACAERGGAEVFLTTDDRVIKRALRISEQLHMRVVNPLAWLTKETEA